MLQQKKPMPAKVQIADRECCCSIWSFTTFLLCSEVVVFFFARLVLCVKLPRSLQPWQTESDSTIAAFRLRFTATIVPLDLHLKFFTFACFVHSFFVMWLRIRSQFLLPNTTLSCICTCMSIRVRRNLYLPNNIPSSCIRIIHTYVCMLLLSVHF